MLTDEMMDPIQVFISYSNKICAFDSLSPTPGFDYKPLFWLLNRNRDSTN
jgi:hypothetical protein